MVWQVKKKMGVRTRIGFARRRPAGEGFTLVELLTVLVVIGILTGIALPRFSEMKIRATITVSKQNLAGLANATHLFRLDRGFYPVSHSYDSRIDLRPLTSLYISTIDIPDPFQRKPASDQLETEFDTDASLRDGEGIQPTGFVYVHYRDFIGEDIPRIDGIGIYSIGPDRVDSWLSLYPLPEESKNIIRRCLYAYYGDSALDSVVVYSPTNGTFSRGDYGVFRGDFNGFVPTDFQ